ncbi:MAG: hypothetical protein Q4G49_03440 [Paracoccus sp. (in: a-proteobacteria)]|nr:hypothetical protein [Paracoccus sp. (in: a-proteobacteria)]
MDDQGWCNAGEPAVPDAASEEMQNESVLAAIERVARAEREQGLDAVEFASKLLWSYVGDLERRWQDMERNAQQGPDKQALKDALQAARDVRDASKLLSEERGKVDKLRKDIAGSVGGGSLDLDAARDEIGRRLACLRRAGGG